MDRRLEIDGVDRAYVAVKRLSNGKWLRPNGRYGRKAWLDARVVDRGATSTAVRFSFRPPARGQYVVQMRVADEADNRRKARNVRFKVIRR